MNKLGEIFDEFISQIYIDSLDENRVVKAVVKIEPYKKIRQQIKDLMLDLIGEDEVAWTDSTTRRGNHKKSPIPPARDRNRLRAELRQKIEEEL